jgi:hypothetical protein
MKYAMAFALLLGGLPTSAAAASVDTAGVTKCDLNSYSTDTDPKGTNIRSAPNASAPIIGHVPPEPNSSSEETEASSFHIIGAKNGWLLIENVVPGGTVGQDTGISFKGPGWISGALAGFTVGSVKLHSAPAISAPVVAKLGDESKGYGPDSYAVKRVNACQGTFADITVQLPPGIDKHAKPVRGWAAAVCDTQLTTCDPGGTDD